MRGKPRIAAIAGAALLSVAVACGGDRATETGSASDRDVAQRIRQALVADPALSAGAKNVAIAAGDDSVTLRGAVPTEEERAAVVAKAKQVAGARRVDNQIEVARR